ncbi:hypothetical protein SAMN06273567_103264 [Geodermatophilus aquaeductus]|uniref:Neocarzinostatin family protein n=1 Tax=Geodermatophilus aquaeductus TaxID=1564161 RepID=A0A521DJB5_9ACTN|nr:hypothetical protein [Geodermatophilus aquaeductus]SMO71819.1 hypothetical protein SAMN06273567_103264 [Geodermatophilus aquaeductus]
MRRIALVLFALLLGLVVAAPPAAAVPPGTETRLLGELWTTTLQTPLAKNPLAGGDPCVPLSGRVVAPFSAFFPELTCTVAPGTRVFVAGLTVECSTVEPPPFAGTDPASLRDCALAGIRVAALTVTLDGAPLPLTKVVTGPLAVALPDPNILSADPGPATSVAAGRVALTRPLPVGCHVIAIAGTLAPRNPVLVAGAAPASFSNTTTIAVSPRGRTVTCD